MNHYLAREIHGPDGEGTGLYRYTSSNRRTGTFAVGYCRDGCPGHDSPEGAYAHQKEYLLDCRLRFNDGPEKPDTLHRCAVEGCEEMTAGTAYVGAMQFWHLCAEHRTREVVAGLVLVGESWSSY